MSIAHQKDVALVAGGVTSAVASLALGADPASIAVWFQAVIDSLTARIQAGYAINRNSAMTYLRQHGALHGAQVTPMPGSLDVAALRKRLEITGPIGFKSAIAAGQDPQLALRHMATNMAGVADENVRNGDRHVITRTAEYGRGVVGWRRRLSGRACGFCAMLASRGAVYVTRASAGLSSHSSPYHPHCHCWAEPLYEHQQEPREVRDLQAQWNRITAGQMGNDKAIAWRRHWENRATPAGRARNNIPERTFRGLEEPSPSVAKAMEQADIPLPTAGKVTRLEDLPRIADPSDIATQARATNPKVSQTYAGPKTPEIEKHGAYYSTNCTRTAIAYEMRRRGYDVTAGAATIKGDTAAAYVRTFRQEGRYAVRVAEDLNRNMSLRDIAAEVQTWPKGARGIVTMQGHTMNVERSLTTGRAVFVEAQSASRTPGMTAAALEKKLAPRRVPTDKWMAVARVDDLELSDYSLRYVESPELDIAHGQVGKTSLPQSPRSVEAGFSVQASSEELAAMVPDDTYQGLARSATELRRAVTERGITVPTGLRPDALRKLVDDLDKGVPAATARETALQTIVEERRAVASLVSQVDEALYNEASDRALASLAVQAERLPAELKQSRTLAAALRSGDREKIRAEATVLSRASKLSPAKGAAAGDVVALDRSTMTVLGDAGERNGTLVFVVRPGYTTTVERRALTLERAGVQPATAEQIVRARAATPVKAAKATVKKAPAKAVPSRAVGVSPGDVEIRDVSAGSGNIGVYVDGKWAGTIIVEDGRLSRLELAGGSRRSDVHFFSQDRRAIEDEVRHTIAAEQTAKDVQAGLKAMPRHTEMVSRQAIGHRETTRAGWIVEADHQTGQVVVTYRGMGLSEGPQLKAEALANYRTVLESRGFRVVVEDDRLIVSKGSAPAKAVAKKATPAKKVPAPKAPPAPAKMTAPALRKELQPVIDAAPDQWKLTAADLQGVPPQTMARWVERSRTLPQSQLGEEVGRWRQSIIDRRRDLADMLSEADELVSAGASPAALASRGASRLRRWEQAAEGWPDLAAGRALLTAMQTGDARKIRTAIKAAQRKLGLKQVGEDAGKLTRFDRATMKPIGKPIPDGAPVEVVRPGYTVQVGGREVVLSRPVVEVASR